MPIEVSGRVPLYDLSPRLLPSWRCRNVAMSGRNRPSLVSLQTARSKSGSWKRTVICRTTAVRATPAWRNSVWDRHL